MSAYGVYEAMNKGLRMATGDVVGYLNSDDVFKDRHVIETIAQTLNSRRLMLYLGMCCIEEGMTNDCFVDIRVIILIPGCCPMA